MMAAEGIVGDYKGSKAREVVMSLDAWEAKHGKPSGPRPPETVDEHYERLDDAAEDDGDEGDDD